MFECLWFELWEVKFMLLIVDIIVLFVLVVSKLAFGGISTWVFILFSEYPTLRLPPPSSYPLLCLVCCCRNGMVECWKRVRAVDLGLEDEL